MSDPAVDERGLAAYLAAHLPHHAGAFTLERLGQGQSCLTYLVRGDGWELVLRRPPRGALPRGANDVAREHRVMSALVEAGAPVPVPRPLALCGDPGPIGAPFMLMERVPGVVVRDEVPAEVDGPGERRRMGEAMVDALVAIGQVDWRAAGLEDFGRPEGYLQRQLARMSGQWEQVRAREIPEIDEVGAWLAANLPASPAPAIVHGDLKLDNLILAPRPPARVAAVVDWELSTIGDPLADLGWALYFWREDGEPAFAIPVANATALPGFPRRAELVERYARRCEVPVEGARWYAALAGWKIAIIMESSYRRYLGGMGDHDTFAALEEGVPGLARRALAASRGELL